MNITFLIGNGFDLNLGLKTSYLNFIEHYLRHNIIEESAEILYFKRNIYNDKRSWANAEMAFGEYTSRYSGPRGLETFLNCHENFCEKLGEYLSSEEKKFDDQYLGVELVPMFADSLQNITTGFREEQAQQIQHCINSTGGPLVYNFISFNYTTTLDKIKSVADEEKTLMGVRHYMGNNYSNYLGELVHVHGYVDRDMVLGVNDESQIKNIDLFDNSDEEDIAQIIKPQTNIMNERNIDDKVKNIINDSDLIYIYGMSIGETDAIWWQRICELLILKQNLRVIIHQFDAPEQGLILRKYRKYEKEIREKFVKFYDAEENTLAYIKSKIHITNANIFNKLHNVVEEYDANDLMYASTDLTPSLT